MSQPPTIVCGNVQPPYSGVIWNGSPVYFEHTFDSKGYQQEFEEHEHGLSLGIRLAVATAMADGAFHDAEGNAIKQWIRRKVAVLPQHRQEATKSGLNHAFKSAFDDARHGALDVDEALDELSEIEASIIKYEVLQLAFDVLAADGKADSSELQFVNRIADALALDANEVSRLRDQKLLGLDMRSMSDSNSDDILGLRPDWDRATIQRHLRSEFQKWNGRISALPQGSERDNAQRMLDKIADARKRYE
jgi:uncharacterized tellurite resistance protein B-like protein